MGEMHKPKNGRGEKMHYHELGYLFEWHGGSGGSDTLLNGPDDTKNKALWKRFGVKCVVLFNDILSHVNRGPM